MNSGKRSGKKSSKDGESSDMYIFLGILGVMMVIMSILLIVALYESGSGSGNAGGSPTQYNHGLARREALVRHGRKVPPLEFTVALTLEEMYSGTKKHVTFERQVLCGGRRCSHCDGHRLQRQRQMDMFHRIHERFFCSYRTKVEVKFAPGVTDGFREVVEDQGNIQSGLLPGDVYVTTMQKMHRRFRRSKESPNDLHINIRLSLKEALVGFHKSIEHLDGRQVNVTSSGVTGDGAVVILPGEGMPGAGWLGGSRGDLKAAISVKFPRRIEDDVLRRFDELFPE